ncbi:MAG: hypothetical protein J6Y67_04400 [Lachnospiraceae bacterium]|nr:hypothetical protein [Lachnospiraceae bacterium]
MCESMYEIKCEKTAELEHVYLMFRDLPEGNPFEEEMLGHNIIPGVLPMQTVRVGEGKMRRYAVDGCASLAESFQGQKISGAELRRILASLFAGVAESKKFLLREECFVLRPDCIFLRKDTGETELVYCPEYEKPLTMQLRALSDWLIGRIDSQDSQAVLSGYAFHVMSHEEGSTMQRMLTAVVREPERVQPSPVYQLPGDESGYVVAAVAEEGVYETPRNTRKKGFRGLLSFFSGISVLFVLACALMWAMG